MNRTPQDDFDNDDYVAGLLKKEAAEKNFRYSAVGLQALLPKRLTKNAPKPNTRFLRNIVREADSHNTALLAKEAEESQLRLKALKEKDRKDRQLVEVRDGRLSPPPEETWREKDPAKKPKSSSRRKGESGDEKKRNRERSREGGHRERSRSPDRERRSRRKRSHSRDRSSTRRRHKRHRSRSSLRHGDRDRDRDRERDRHRDKDRDRKKGNPASPKKRDPHRHRKDQKDQPTPKNSHTKKPPHQEERHSSDPLESIIGPSPLSPPPRPRGRGATTISGRSAMDTHFSSKYDPTLDVNPDSHQGAGGGSGSGGGGSGDWDMAIEAFRDRQKWKQQGAERLRSAGFDEAFITAWENNSTQDAKNIKWTGKGGMREWDRGKVVEEETGEVVLRAAWNKKSL